MADAVSGPTTIVPLALRRLVRVDGISYPSRPGITHDDTQAEIPTEQMLVALAGSGAPVAFVVVGGPVGVALSLGTWTEQAESTGPATLDYRMRVLTAAIRGVYPSIDTSPMEHMPIRWPMGGLALGVPTVDPPDLLDGTIAIDRLVRALTGMRWGLVILAEPLREKSLATLANRLINEMRGVAAFEQSAGAPSPLARHYDELLRAGLDIVTRSQSVGGWRTAVYLLGDEVSYPCLASAWRAIHSGSRSLPEPVRVFDGSEAVDLASRWAMPSAATDSTAPDEFHHPYACQTVLSSRELSGLVQLPRSELPGFAIRIAPSFDVVPPPVERLASVAVGSVIHREQPTAITYGVTLRSLTRHAFVAGVTGSGKTNTILHLLTEVAAHGTPFLVIEPAKTEYRTLLDHPTIGRRVRVFTPGKERVAPFRLNPFEVPPGAEVATHLDLLRAVFGASFAMWGPLPHVLERCLNEIYLDRGWDLGTNLNHRLGEEAAIWSAFPTLTDLSQKVKEVVPSLGYEQRVTDDIRAALLTRLDSLRSGGKGAMLDVLASIPMRELLDAPTIIELEGVGDDDDKAFLIGLLLIRLAEYRRAAGQTVELAHLLVIEEAHRLLTNVTRDSEYGGDPRGQAVDTFTNLLSEIRAYGQGVLIADQVPMRLAPDVIKNTNLKIAHRIVASDDRAVLGGTMAMTDVQSRYVSTLASGRAAAFSEGDDAPVLVAVPRVKNGAVGPDDGRIAQAMTQWRLGRDLEGLYRARPFCVQTCADADWACKMARRLLEDELVQGAVARLALSTAEHADAADRLWPEVVWVLRARRPARVDEEVLLRAFAGHAADWYSARRGAQGGWSYRSTEALAAALRELMVEKVAGISGGSPARESFQRQMREMHRRAFAPYPACDRVCDHAQLCLYRSAADDLVRSRRYEAPWRQAEAADEQAAGEHGRKNTWRTAWSTAYELVEIPHAGMSAAERESVTGAARRAALCFAQQMAATDERKVPSTARWVIDRVLDEADRSSAT
ncbi:DUF87 domain-containing protein [Kribbella sp. NBC_01484]|uniref:ATP-binding protein n=1 Tax=Kribbella sp. NBC_01484 TaxID=2903579 RepID=UPI002E34517F|nr:DUF87 domain-containing protein [Kribbella sp. NBC_01484]